MYLNLLVPIVCVNLKYLDMRVFIKLRVGAQEQARQHLVLQFCSFARQRVRAWWRSCMFLCDKDSWTSGWTQLFDILDRSGLSDSIEVGSAVQQHWNETEKLQAQSMRIVEF